MPSPHSVHLLLPPEEEEPKEHGSQRFVAASALVPAKQNVHELCPSAVLTKPSEDMHAVQADDAAPEILPAGQREQVPALLALFFPPGQFVHASAPIKEKVPALHSTQVAKPSPAYVPASQFEAQLDEPAPLKVPTGQLSHASRLGVLFFPLSHWAQEPAWPVGE